MGGLMQESYNRWSLMVVDGCLRKARKQRYTHSAIEAHLAQPHKGEWRRSSTTFSIRSYRRFFGTPKAFVVSCGGPEIWSLDGPLNMV